MPLARRSSLPNPTVTDSTFSKHYSFGGAIGALSRRCGCHENSLATIFEILWR